MSIIQIVTFVFLLVNLITGSPVAQQTIKYNNNDVSTRIVGGQPAPEGFAPHMVALLVGDIFTLMICGGSIVSIRHVLTAAHCINSVINWWDPTQLMASLRGVIGSNKHTSKENLIRFESYINHPHWHAPTLKNDVGVLITTNDIVLGDRVASIALKSSWVDGGALSLVTGWGSDGNFTVPDYLQLLYVRTLSGLECIEGVAVAAIVHGAIPPPVDPRVEICTFHAPGQGMCHGDSGSALILEKTGEQIGIVSWGFPCAVGAPDVFVRISGVWDFLQPILKFENRMDQ